VSRSSRRKMQAIRIHEDLEYLADKDEKYK